MSESSQGPGWWQASDLKWYPPENHPDAVASLPPPPSTALPPSPAPEAGSAPTVKPPSLSVLIQINAVLLAAGMLAVVFAWLYHQHHVTSLGNLLTWTVVGAIVPMCLAGFVMDRVKTLWTRGDHNAARGVAETARKLAVLGALGGLTTLAVFASVFFTHPDMLYGGSGTSPGSHSSPTAGHSDAYQKGYQHSLKAVLPFTDDKCGILSLSQAPGDKDDYTRGCIAGVKARPRTGSP